MSLFDKFTQRFKQVIWKPGGVNEPINFEKEMQEEECKTITKNSLPELLLIELGKQSHWSEKTLVRKSLGDILVMIEKITTNAYTTEYLLNVLKNLENAGLLKSEKRTFILEETKQKVTENFYTLTLSGLIFAKILDTLKNKYATLDYNFKILVEESITNEFEKFEG